MTSKDLLTVLQNVPVSGAVTISSTLEFNPLLGSKFQLFSNNKIFASVGSQSATLTINDGGVLSYFIVNPDFLGIPNDSDTPNLAQVNMYGGGLDFRYLSSASVPPSTSYHPTVLPVSGTLQFQNFHAYGYFYTFVEDDFAVGINNQGYLVDSNVMVSATPVFYSSPQLSISPSSALVASSGLATPSMVIDNQLTIAVKNLSTTVDTTSYAIGRVAQGIEQAVVHLNNIQDVGLERLSLSADVRLFPDIFAATASNGTLILTSNGHATVGEWQAALRAVTYQDLAARPATGVRTVTFDFNDGVHASYLSKQDYIVVTGVDSSQLLRAAVEPNDPNNNLKLAFDIGTAQNAGDVYRLYTAFDRSPDVSGLGYWINALDNGAKLSDVAQRLIKTPEFINRYGANPSNGDYISNLYQNILHRPGDAEGLAYWSQQLNSGALTQADVLAQFVTLTEGAAKVAPLIAHGITYAQWFS